MMKIMRKRKFSNDPKVKLVSLEELLLKFNFLIDLRQSLYDSNEKITKFGHRFKITSSHIIAIDYNGGNLSMRTILGKIRGDIDTPTKHSCIYIAERDGVTEYNLFDKRIFALQDMVSGFRKPEKIEKTNKEIRQVKTAKKLLPKYEPNSCATPKEFVSYLVDMGYKTEIENFKNKYVILDVETNGLRKNVDDLLSISIYDPTMGICYNRYLPLDLQPVILTGWIHGITDETLEMATHITQEEFNELINYFNLNEKIILSFSGGQGTFDASFLENYCKRHNISGYENFKHENIKSIVPYAGFGNEGLLSKDNLCRLFKIDGVEKIHSSMNDCLLEWKLFEKIKDQPLFFINQHLMKYNDGYIVPVSYLNSCPDLVKYANIVIPYIENKATLIYDYSLPKEILNLVKKFPTNITGIALENGINSKLQVVEQDNFLFLYENKKYLEDLGTLESRLAEIPVQVKKDGTIQSLDKEHEEYIKEVNAVTKAITENIQPVFDFIKNEIFKNEKISSQELSVSDDNKVLAICDLSSKTKVMEIKTFSVIQDGVLSKKVGTQLFYESKGRKKYVLSIDFEKELVKADVVISNVFIRIYEIDQTISAPRIQPEIYTLFPWQKKILRVIKKNPNIKNIEIAKKTRFSQATISIELKFLKELGYISNRDEFNKKVPWKILRAEIDDKTPVIYERDKIVVYKE